MSGAVPGYPAEWGLKRGDSVWVRDPSVESGWSRGEVVDTRISHDAYLVDINRSGISVVNWMVPADLRATTGVPEGWSFESALSAIKDGDLMARRAWKGKGMFVFLREASSDLQEFLAMRTAECKMVPWTPTQEDLLTDDWEVLPG